MKYIIKATSPCYKFIEAKPAEQIRKLYKEVDEVDKAWQAFTREKNEDNLIKLFEELIDVKVCINTAMIQINLSVSEENEKQMGTEKRPLWISDLKDKAKRIVIEKNMKRGYYQK